MNKPLKRAIKGGVLICGRQEKKGRVAIWVLAVPEIRAEARTLEEAEESLLEQIWDACDLDEPVALRYESDDSWQAESAVIQVSVNEVTDINEPSRYFEEGFCMICQAGKGRRNSEFLQLKHIPRGSSGVTVRFQPYFKCGMRVGMTVLHASICEALKKECKPLLQFRQVVVKDVIAADFYELIPTTVFPSMIPLNRQGRVGGKCPKCGGEYIYHEPGKRFIRRIDANSIREHGAAAIDTYTKPTLCVSGRIWAKIKKMKAGRGLLDYPIQELDQAEILIKPKLEKIVPFTL